MNTTTPQTAAATPGKDCARNAARENERARNATNAPATANSPSAPSWRPVLRWLLSITRPVHPPLFFSIAMRIISQSANVLLFAAAGGGLVAAWLGQISLGLLVTLLASLALVRAGTYYLEQFSGHYVAFKALELLRGEAFHQLWPKAPGIVARSRSGVLYASLTRDIDRIEVLYAHTIAPVVAGIVVPIAAVITGGALAGWPPILVPVSCVVISVAVVPLVGLRAGIRGAAQSLARRAKLSQHTTDSVFGAREVTGYGQEATRLQEMRQLSTAVTQAVKYPALYRGIRRGANAAFVPLAVAGAVLCGVQAALDPVLIGALAAGCLALFEAPRGLEDAAGGVDLSLAAARRLYILCHAADPVADGSLDFVSAIAELPAAGLAVSTPVTAADATGTHTAAAAAAAILPTAKAVSVQWRDVHYSYPGERRREVLHGFNLTVPAGGYAAIVGPSGSGKSTAVQLLLRYDDPASGEILLAGRPVSDYTLESLRRAVAFVPQRAQVLRGTIAQNLRLAKPDATTAQLWEALRIAQLDQQVREMPHGLAEPIGTEGAGLSGGQLQRLTLARALLTRPAVLVLDEFSANLPAALDTAIRAALTQAFPQLTVIEVTHRPQALPAGGVMVQL